MFFIESPTTRKEYICCFDTEILVKGVKNGYRWFTGCIFYTWQFNVISFLPKMILTLEADLCIISHCIGLCRLMARISFEYASERDVEVYEMNFVTCKVVRYIFSFQKVLNKFLKYPTRPFYLKDFFACST